MKHNLRKQFKISLLIIVALGALCGIKKADAQIVYWSQAGGNIPARTDPATGCMAYSNGILYVPYLDLFGNLVIAKWDGVNWITNTIPGNFDSAELYNSGAPLAICLDASSDVYVAGGFNDTSGYFVIKWDGTNWSKVGDGASALHANWQITALCVDPNQNLYAAGYFTNDSGEYYVTKWDGSAWSVLGNSVLNPDNFHGTEPPQLLAYNNYIYATGYVLILPGVIQPCIFQWDGFSWTTDTFQFPGNGGPICAGPGNSVYACNQGDVWQVSNGNWVQVGSGDGVPNGANSICTDAAGNIYVCAWEGFGNNTNMIVSKWDGNNWSELGTNNFALHANNKIFSVLATGVDQVYATGLFTNPEGYDYIAQSNYVPPGRLFVYLNNTVANCNYNTGSVTATVYQGTPPYTYAWSTGDTSVNIDSLTAGTYFVTVTDANGLVATGDAVVQQVCQSFVTGHVFIDSLGNCAYNGSQPGIVDLVVALSGNGQTQYGTTDSTGAYSIAVADTGVYFLAVEPGATSSCANFIHCGNAGNVVVISVVGDSSNGNNFTHNPASLSYDLTLHPGWTSADPGFQKEYWVMPFNLSPVNYNGTATIVFTYDSSLIYQSSLAPQPVVDTIAHTLTWTINGDSIPYPTFNWNNYRFICYFQVPASLSLSYQLQSTFVIYPYQGDCDTTNNYFYYSEPVTGSHDPNYKEVTPSGALGAADSVLTYTIHFQNTGTDSTYFITVADTLSPYLNPASVRNLASSAPYSSFSISGGGILTWVFVPYSLPDSSTDPSGSKGFITFSVKRQNSLHIGTELQNSASVFFDYNPGIATNTVTDTVATCTPNATAISQTICTGDTLYIGTTPYYSTGNSTDTLTNASGCDSIVSLQLTVHTPDTLTLSHSICAGDSFYIFGNYVSTAGTYDSVLGNCDTIFIFTLTVLDTVPPTFIYDTVCYPNTVFLDGVNYDTSGIYTANLASVNGCDSLVTLYLTVNYRDTINVSNDICQGDSFYFYGTYYYNTITYDTLVPGGCDTFYIFTLVVKDTSPMQLYDTICASDSILFNGMYYNASGTYSAHYTSILGCDSLVNLYLTVTQPDTISMFGGICAGGSYYFYGTVIHSPGQYDTLLAGGCDTLVMLSLVVQDPLPPTNVYDTICSSDSILFNGAYYYTPGTYSAHLTSTGGCDSTVNLHLSFTGTDTVTLIQAICNSDSFYFYGQYLHATGQYDTLLTSGCDTLVTLFLVVAYPSPLTRVYDTICSNDSILFNGIYYDTSGTYTAHLSNVNGCDSAVNLYLTVNALADTALSPIICLGDTFYIGGNAYYIGGNYTDTFTSVNGCDSIINLSLLVSGSVSDSIAAYCPQTPGNPVNDCGNTSGFSAQFQGEVNSFYWRVGDTILYNLSSLLVGLPEDSAGEGLNLAVIADNTYTVCLTALSSCGSATFCDTFRITTAGIATLNASSAVSIYPNPANSLLYIKTAGIHPENIIIYDVDGQAVLTQPFTPELDIHNLAPGVYLLEINSVEGVARKRWVKM